MAAPGPATGTDPASPEAGAAALRLLELLAADASAVELAAQPARARADGADDAGAAQVEQTTEVALAVRRVLDRYRRRETELVALFDTVGDLAQLRDLDAVLRAIVRRARTLLGADVAYLTLNDPAAGDTFMRVTDGSVSAAFQQLRLGMGEGLGGLVAQTARPYASRNYGTDHRFRHTGPSTAVSPTRVWSASWVFRCGSTRGSSGSCSPPTGSPAISPPTRSRSSVRSPTTPR